VHDFSEYRSVLDLGGGTGSFLVALLRKHPRLRTTLFELPTVAPVARLRLHDEADGQHVTVVAGDFFTDAIPTGFDAVILANVVHLFSPERKRELLRRIRHAVPATSRLLLVDFWTDPTHTRPLPAALLAGEFLMIGGEGDVYSEHEVRGWLSACGWQPIEHKALAGVTSLLVAEAA